jgi:hypothetical protein
MREKSMRQMSVPPKIRIAISIGVTAAVALVVLQRSDLGALSRTLEHLSLGPVLLALTALTVGTAIAVLRAKLIAQDVGYTLRWRDAAAVLSYGSLAGAAFFQVFGQLIARGAYLSARGVPIGATVVMVGYERFLALAVSVVLATAGAWAIFGQLSFDLNHGGDEFVKILVGLTLATTAGAYLSWGKLLFSRDVSHDLLGRVSRNTLLSFAIQLLTMCAYVVIARALAPDVPLLHIAAASTVVMLAASLPISLAGWGVRELSAVLALGAVGVSSSAALLTAVSVGVLALVVVALVAATAAVAPASMRSQPIENAGANHDYTRLVSLGLPLAAATLIFFQLHIPTGTGLVTANLADPLAILAGSLFVVVCFSYDHRWPVWRLSGFNAHLLAATGIIVSSLLLGAYRFGWTNWALFNKALGWLVLLAYAGTGALIVRTAGREGLRQFLLAFAAAGAAIVVLHLVLVAIRLTGVDLAPTILGYNMEGFAENRNAFAFQLVMVLAVACALADVRRDLSTIIQGLALAGLWYAGSRAGWLTLPFLFVAAVYARAISARQIALAAGVAIIIVGAISIIPFIVVGIKLALNLVASGAAWDEIENAFHKLSLYDQSSNAERVKSLKGGLALFLKYPVFGAGLGAFMEAQLRETGTALVIHSTPLWLLAETGLVGFAVFAVPVFRIFWSEGRRPHPDLASKLLLLIIVAFAVMSSVHEMLYQRTFWLLLGAAMAYLPVATSSSQRVTTSRLKASENDALDFPQPVA